MTLGEIFRQYGAQYLERYADRLSVSQRQALCTIAGSRTEALGGQVYHCAACDETRYSYHSCRNRHCPQCQHTGHPALAAGTASPVAARTLLLLTFTLPAELAATAATPLICFTTCCFIPPRATQELAHDPRFIGGQLGLIGILQTWDRNLTYHPHIHYVVPGGGWDPTTRPGTPPAPTFCCLSRRFPCFSGAKFREGLHQHTRCSATSRPPSGSKTGSCIACPSAMAPRRSSTWRLTFSRSPSVTSVS